MMWCSQALLIPESWSQCSYNMLFILDLKVDNQIKDIMRLFVFFKGHGGAVAENKNMTLCLSRATPLNNGRITPECRIRASLPSSNVHTNKMLDSILCKSALHVDSAIYQLQKLHCSLSFICPYASCLSSLALCQIK
jgi:hypothetical protein